MYIANRFFLHLGVFVILCLLPLHTRGDTEGSNYWDNHGLLFSVALVLQPHITLLFFSSVPWTMTFVICALLFPEVTAISLFFERGYHYNHYLLLLAYIPLAFSRYFKFDSPQLPPATRNDDGTLSFSVAPEVASLVLSLAQSISSLCTYFLKDFSLRSEKDRTTTKSIIFAKVRFLYSTLFELQTVATSGRWVRKSDTNSTTSEKEHKAMWRCKSSMNGFNLWFSLSIREVNAVRCASQIHLS